MRERGGGRQWWLGQETVRWYFDRGFGRTVSRKFRGDDMGEKRGGDSHRKVGCCLLPCATCRVARRCPACCRTPQVGILRHTCFVPRDGCIVFSRNGRFNEGCSMERLRNCYRRCGFRMRPCFTPFFVPCLRFYRWRYAMAKIKKEPLQILTIPVSAACVGWITNKVYGTYAGRTNFGGGGLGRAKAGHSRAGQACIVGAEGTSLSP